MKKITNKSDRFLTFPSLDFSIDAGETKEVTDQMYLVLKDNVYIQISVQQPSEKKVERKLEENKVK